ARTAPCAHAPPRAECPFRDASCPYPKFTLGQPFAIGSAPPAASNTWSPARAAGRPLMNTVALPLVTTPIPCGAGPDTVGHVCVSVKAAIAATAAPAAPATAVCKPDA